MSDTRAIRSKIDKELASLSAEVDVTENRLHSMRKRMKELTCLLAACEESDRAAAELRQLAQAAGVLPSIQESAQPAAALRQLAQAASVRTPVRDFNKSDRTLSQAELDERQYGIKSWDPT